MYRRKPRRLPTHDYTGCQQLSVRFCTLDRDRVFVDAAAVEPVLLQFLRAAKETDMAIVAYCFMPDHVHLLVEGQHEGAQARRFISLAKQYSGYGYSRRTSRPLWQRFAYERVLRSVDSTREFARYILANPLRAGLVTKAEDYPFSGSFTQTVQQLLEDR